MYNHIEMQRKNIYKKIVGLILSIILVFIFFVIITNHIVHALLFGFIFLLVIANSAKKNIDKSIKKYAVDYKKYMVKDLLEKVFDNLEYKPEEGLDVEKIQQSRFN